MEAADVAEDGCYCGVSPVFIEQGVKLAHHLGLTLRRDVSQEVTHHFQATRDVHVLLGPGQPCRAFAYAVVGTEVKHRATVGTGVAEYSHQLDIVPEHVDIPHSEPTRDLLLQLCVAQSVEECDIFAECHELNGFPRRCIAVIRRHAVMAFYCRILAERTIVDPAVEIGNK